MDINEDTVKTRLIEDGYPQTSSLDVTVNRLLSLEGKAKDMLRNWMQNGDVPVFDAINGVGSLFLKDKLGMKIPAVILAFSMLEDKPEEASAHFKQMYERGRMIRPIFTKNHNNESI